MAPLVNKRVPERVLLDRVEIRPVEDAFHSIDIVLLRLEKADVRAERGDECCGHEGEI